MTTRSMLSGTNGSETKGGCPRRARFSPTECLSRLVPSRLPSDLTRGSLDQIRTRQPVARCPLRLFFLVESKGVGDVQGLEHYRSFHHLQIIRHLHILRLLLRLPHPAQGPCAPTMTINSEGTGTQKSGTRSRHNQQLRIPM